MADGRVKVIQRAFVVSKAKRGKKVAPLLRKPVKTAIRPTNPTEGFGGNAGSPPFGSVLVTGSQWFGGRGVDVVSNGAGYDCPGGYCTSYTYGIKWQCVELVNRFLMTRGWSGRIYGDAKYIYANAPTSSFDKHPAGDGYVPVAGDVMVWGGNKYGHVAVVDGVGGGYVTFVEQNASPTGRNSLKLGGNALPAIYSRSMTFTGYLHAKANVRATPPPPPPVDLTQYNNKIVQWSGDTKTQKTAWLVLNGKRYWIPDSATYNCLKTNGYAGPVVLPANILDALPDQKGQSVTCSSPVTPPPPPSATITVNTCNTYNNCTFFNPIYVHSNPSVSSRIGDVYNGSQLTARCWTGGRVLTDGSNNTTEDDARQFTSGLWYGVDWSGTRGYVPAVWTTKQENHLGLPAC
jgi:surface antigen